MNFNSNYLRQFYKKCETIQHSYSEPIKNSFVIGNHINCPVETDVVIAVMEAWINGVEQLLSILEETEGYQSSHYQLLFKQRGVRYNEFFYLCYDQNDDFEFLKHPAFVFTKTINNKHRKFKYSHLSFTPEDYKKFILQHDLEPCKFFNWNMKALLPIESLYSHTYCVGKTRSGKTELLKLMVNNIIKQKDSDTSLLIIDPHGQIATELRRLKVFNQKLENFIYIDPALDEKYSPTFNPFDISNNSEAHLAYSTDNILDAFQQLIKDQSLTGNMKRLLRHCIYVLLLAEDVTLMDLFILLSGLSRNKNKKIPEFNNEELKLLEVGRNSPDPITRSFFDYGWKDVDTRTLSAVIERVDSILSHPIVRRFLVGNNSLDFESYLNTGKIVLVNLDFTKLGNIGSEAIGRLIISEAQNISAQRNRIPKGERPKTIIVIDECQRCVSPTVERALSEFAKFQTYLILAHQFAEQLDDTMIKAMLSNTENKIIGRNSADSMSSIASDIGVSKEELMKIKKYQFYFKSGDQDAFLFQSDDKLVNNDREYYLTEEEAKDKIDRYMICHYYKNDSNRKEFAFTATEKYSSTDITLHPDDF